MDVKWIKIVTDVFDDEKILLIESMPDADAVIVIWFKLLCLAGKMNNHGVFILSGKIPYTEEMLATIFRRPVNTVRMALGIFEQYGMIEVIDGVYTIPNWEKHQSLDKLEAKKEYDRDYQAKRRAEQKLLAESSQTINRTMSDDVSNDNRSIDKKKNKKEKENKNNYGSFSNVLLTEDEFIRLGKDYGEELRDETIEWFSSYIKEKHYKNYEHNLCIRRWVMDAVQKERSKNGFKNSVGNSKESTETDDDRRFYSSYSEEECDRLLAEYEANGY